MDLDPLQQFARQLHAWSKTELEIKPGPFRTVELFPKLLTINGYSSPPIVFWVNRESHLAGGVILLPKKDPTEVYDSALDICSALGLDHYYTWGVGEVSAWGVDTGPGRLWAEPLPRVEIQDEKTVRAIHALILENMQNRFYTQQQQQPHLSALYLTNLLHHCIESATFITAKRDCNENTRRGILAGAILQMLALRSQNTLPVRTEPNTLLAALRHESLRLPAPMASVFKYIDSASILLPENAIIKLHHLCHRLHQLGPELVIYFPETIKRLLRFWVEQNGLSSLPAPLKKGALTLIVNPDRYHPETSVAIEVGSPAVIAATALLRHLQSPDRKHPSQYSDLMERQSVIEVDAVSGSVLNSSRASISEQKQMNALLRYSWPNRNLKFAATTPQWTWRVIHLVGLLQGAPVGTLNLPADWLWSPYGEQFFILFSERVAMNRISPVNHNQVRVEFNRSNKNQIMVDSYAKELRILGNSNSEVTRTDLLLALSLPTKIYDLLRSGELTSNQKENLDPDAVELFAKSSIGRSLWRILAPKKPLPKKTGLSVELIRIKFPLPGPKTLDALGELARNHTHPDTASIDRELVTWLGEACKVKCPPIFREGSEAARPKKETNLIEDSISELIQSGEVLAFPQDYLYSVPNNARIRYSISGPLDISASFFNRVTLSTTVGTAIQVEGMSTARALQLISSVQQGEVELPEDEQEVEVLLERYLRDLDTLYNRLLMIVSNSDQSGMSSLTEQIWNRLPVPPRDLIES